MLRLLRKNLFMFLFYIVIYFGFLLPMINSEKFTGAENLEFGFMTFWISYIFWLLIGSIWSHEQTEHKNNSYQFLRILPIHRRDIIGSKFILVLVTMTIYLIFNSLWLSSLFRGTEFQAATQKYLVFMAFLSLGISGLIYLMLFKIGFTKFGKIIIVIWLLPIVGQIPLRIFLKRQYGIRDADIAHWAERLDLLPVIIISLAVFALSYYFSLRIKWAEPG